MATCAQVEANRANAGRSTGPRTEAGKAASSRNATRHGMTAALTLEVEKQLLPEEDRARFMGYFECMMEDYEPQGELEEMLVERLCVLQWRQRRLSELEVKIYIEEPVPVPSQMEAFVRRLNSLGRYENTLMRLVRETEGRLRELKQRRMEAMEWERRYALEGEGDEEDEEIEEEIEEEGKREEVAVRNEAKVVVVDDGPKSVRPLVGRVASAGEMAVAKLLRGK